MKSVKKWELIVKQMLPPKRNLWNEQNNFCVTEQFFADAATYNPLLILISVGLNYHSNLSSRD